MFCVKHFSSRSKHQSPCSAVGLYFQVSGAAPGVAAVGQTADLLPQCSTPHYQRASSSQSQASSGYQLPPAGQLEHYHRQPRHLHQHQQQYSEEQQRGSWTAVQHSCREDGYKSKTARPQHFFSWKPGVHSSEFSSSILGAEESGSNFLSRKQIHSCSQWQPAVHFSQQ